MSKILILEDNLERIKKFRTLLFNHDLDVVMHAKDAIDKLKENKYNLIFLDHDLNDKQMKWDEDDCGMVVANFMKDNNINILTIIHSFNEQRSKQMEKIIPKAFYIPGIWLSTNSVISNYIE